MDRALPELDDTGLDPADWDALRLQSHRMLDDMLDHLAHIRERPVWQPIPQRVREQFKGGLPMAAEPLSDVHGEFMRDILPYAVGNAHPGFMGWVHGGGTPVGMLAEMLAAGLNANVGGRDQVPVEVERQITAWVRELFGFPASANGIFVTGTSQANLMAVWVARTAALGAGVRASGLGRASHLRAYTSVAAHGCIAQAMDLAGLGTNALRLIPTDAEARIDVAALSGAIAEDQAAGLTPWLLVGTAGTVDVGAIDDLTALADLAQANGLWFHIDGAYGALGMLAPGIATRLRGLERADSIAFDFHKWGQVPYDAGFLLVRDGQRQLDTFSAPAAYLRREQRGLAAGSPWPCDLGPDLSRGFRALKTWFTLKTYGAERLGEMIEGTCALARYLGERVRVAPELELLAPVSLNIVCFRFRSPDANAVNANIVVALQEAGRVAPSTTVLQGQVAIRAAIVNHRTTRQDVDALVEGVLSLGRGHREPGAAR